MFRKSNKTVAPFTASVLAGARDRDDEALPPEVEEGNVEYKLKLVDPSSERLEHLVTQMKWRLAEGGGEALYEIGISDKGHLVGLTDEELDASLTTLKKMAARLHADCSIVREQQVQGDGVHATNILTNISNHLSSVAAKAGTPTIPEEDSSDSTPVRRRVAEVLIRKRVEDEHFLEIRVAIMGGSDVGKSTLLGVLTHSDLDNGYGRSRFRAFNHKHEIETGRTSSISYDIIGFDSAGKLINYSSTNVQTPQQICEMSSKVVTLMDTCGHSKYLKTTISGLTAKQPDYACLIINGADGLINDMAREHLGMAMVLKMPLFVCITKIDVATAEQVKGTVGALLRLLKGPGKRVVPVIVKNEDDMVATVSHLSDGSVIPIFLVSSVTGDNLPNLARFLNLLPHPTGRQQRNGHDALSHDELEDMQFQIHDIYNVPDVGAVVGGSLLQGTLNMRHVRQHHQAFLLGPVGAEGHFVPVQVTSIHRFCRPVQFIRAEQSATLALAPIDVHHHQAPAAKQETTPPPALRRKRKQSSSHSPPPPPLVPIVSAHSADIDSNALRQELVEQTGETVPTLPPLRRGMVLLAMDSTSPRASFSFEASLHVLYHSGALAATQTAVIYCGSIRQTCRITWVHCDAIAATDDRGEGEAPPTSGTLTTGQRGRVSFEFLNEPEWIQPGATLLVREGRVGRMKCVGTVVAAPAVHPLNGTCGKASASSSVV
ncbi:hypothetical protein RI367_003159 [Sorochytrium milnesiophthora]